MYIFCKVYKHKCGKIMKASDYGYTSWKFWVPDKH